MGEFVNIKNLAGSYEGYYWLSDREEPVIVNGTNLPVDNYPEGSIPFIIEAYVYDKTKRESYSVRYADGKYIVCKTENITDEEIKQAQMYIGTRKLGTLKFVQRWEKSTVKYDGLDFMTQEPTDFCFVGFLKKI